LIETLLRYEATKIPAFTQKTQIHLKMFV